MESKGRMCWVIGMLAVMLVILNSAATVRAGDIVHDDDSAPKKPGCANKFVLVWLNSLFFLQPICFFGEY